MLRTSTAGSFIISRFSSTLKIDFQLNYISLHFQQLPHYPEHAEFTAICMPDDGHSD